MMQFWQIAFIYNWVNIDQLRLAVKTNTNLFGEITPMQFKIITGHEY